MPDTDSERRLRCDSCRAKAGDMEDSRFNLSATPIGEGSQDGMSGWSGLARCRETSQKTRTRQEDRCRKSTVEAGRDGRSAEIDLYFLIFPFLFFLRRRSAKVVWESYAVRLPPVAVK